MMISVTVVIAMLASAGLGPFMDPPAQTGAAGLASQTDPSNQAVAPAPAVPRTPAKMKGSTSVSGYKITLEGVGELGDIGERVVKFRPQPNLQSAAQGSTGFSSDQFATGQTFNNGQGARDAVGGLGAAAAAGGGGGVAGGGGAGFGYAFTKPTYGIALKIVAEGGKGKRDKNRYAQLGTAVKIVESDGTIEEAKDSGPVSATWPKFDRQFPGTSGLYVPRRKGLEVPIKEIHGELKITNGRRVEAVFAGARPQTKKVEGEEFAIRSIDETPEGLTVVVAFPPTVAMKKARNLFERVQLMMASMNSYELEVEDNEGNVYVPSGASAAGGGGGGGGAQSFSFNGNIRQRSARASEPELSTMAFRFEPIQGSAIKTITARVVEAEGEPETVPFRIEVQSE